MYRPLSSRRLNVGDRVLVDGPMLDGMVIAVRVALDADFNRQTVVYVKVKDETVCAPLDACIKESQITMYESLEPGDLVVFGRQKRSHGIVLENRTKRVPSITSKSIMVLENGSKRHLSIQREILSVQRAKDTIVVDD